MQNIVIILQLIPALITALKAIEEAIPGSGQGEQKLAAVRGMLEVIDGSISNLWPQISGVIGVMVNLFNATGVFKKA
jgi:prophage DNA circulation protein